MAFFEHILLNILENKRAKNFENSAKCAYKPIFSYSIKNSISSKMSLTTFLHSADDLSLFELHKGKNGTYTLEIDLHVIFIEP